MNAARPDYREFLKVIRREGKPAHIPFYEHIASQGFIERRLGRTLAGLSHDSHEYWQLYVDFWIGMGFDVVPIEIIPNLPLPSSEHGEGGHASESHIVIRNREDFERYAWPDESDLLAFHRFEIAGECLPEGAKLVAGAAMGPFEWVSTMLGIIGMSYLLMDDPDLVGMVFRKIHDIHCLINRRLAKLDCVCATRQGDDLGFRTATFLSPEQLRQYVFPTYREMAAIAHAAGKPFVLHSCGNLAEVYDDIIDCGVDAKHSFEEAILPVEQFKAQYGRRITPLGGLDVDAICRLSQEDLRKYARQKIESCYLAGDPYWCMGTGNSLTDYMPVENYMIVLEEARAVGR